jgi:hypothetical protein
MDALRLAGEADVDLVEISRCYPSSVPIDGLRQIQVCRAEEGG